MGQFLSIEMKNDFQTYETDKGPILIKSNRKYSCLQKRGKWIARMTFAGGAQINDFMYSRQQPHANEICPISTLFLCTIPMSWEKQISLFVCLNGSLPSGERKLKKNIQKSSFVSESYLTNFINKIVYSIYRFVCRIVIYDKLKAF